ncbi:hypothetical protein V500_09980 [Pseudogymnoascus sp. VKM F-4518 (FW-2643)]|nr:hypothetical protein V500_09980 [Pseudogymnoascus sp. VKM F-4518 (FW-2643)]
MNTDEEALSAVYKKIEREKALINAANAMRQQTQNEQVRSKLDTQMREGRRNIQFFEEKMRELQIRTVGQNMDNMRLGPEGSGPQGGGPRNDRDGPPTPPPKDARGNYIEQGGTDQGGYGSGDYSNMFAEKPGGMMPPRHPYAPPAPGSGIPKPRANYSKLDLIKYDTPYLGPRIQLMLSQLAFKLDVEQQYLKGIEKMVQLYSMEGDKKSRADAAARHKDSTQKIILLKQAKKRYEDLHIDMQSSADAPDDDSINTPNLRKPLTGQLSIRVTAVKDVDHAATSRFSRGPETFVAVKVEDNVVARTKTSRTDRWDGETHNLNVEKANEIELTVYDKTGEQALPVGLLWIRISDIAEEMRRKKIEAEINSSGWVSADRMGSGSAAPAQFNAGSQQSPQFGGPTSPGMQPGFNGGGGMAPAPANPSLPPQPIDAWFALEPSGQIQLSLSFVKQTKDRRPFDVGLNRKGAIRQRKELVHEMFGHKFVSQQFYNIMRCALCGDFLKYSAGMQCEDCKYTCHTKCYSSVVTKCISKSNAETDPDEEKINHRIPHRFEKFSNVGANWCCHCGYMLPFGKKNSRKCSECNLTAHAHCVHLVPDFCGMSMAVANLLLEGIRLEKAKQDQKGKSGHQSNLTGKTLRPVTAKSTVSSQAPTLEQRSSYGPSERLPQQTQSYEGASGTSQESINAAKAAYPSQVQQQRQGGDRMSGAATAASIAATAAISGQRQGAYDTSSDYNRASGGYSAAQGKPGYQERPAQQSTYNPADYANVGGVGAYPPALQPPLQQQHQQGAPVIPQYGAIPVAGMPPGAEAQMGKPPVPVPAGPLATRKPIVTPSASDAGAGSRIGLDHFNFLAVLGKGNFGKVMLAETKASKRLYAIKVLKKEFIIENDEVESTRSEKRVFLIANKERHPFLLSLHACFQTETRVYFVMEYISGGDLMLHIQRGQFGTRRAQFYAAEVCLALKYFHENGVIYRDLKLDNILLTMDGHIKIADYGLCKEDMWYQSTTSTFCGTPEFMAPEILLDKKYGRAVDWWAFGVLIYQMLLQQSPFRGEDEEEIYDAILADEPLYPIHMPRDSVSILQKLLTREPEARLGSGPTDAQEIMNQPFFQKINWDDVYNKRIQPPFLPTITSATDTSNFDSEFTSVTPVLTPVQSVLTQEMQEEFRGFSYSADFV